MYFPAYRKHDRRENIIYSTIQRGSDRDLEWDEEYVRLKHSLQTLPVFGSDLIIAAITLDLSGFLFWIDNPRCFNFFRLLPSPGEQGILWALIFIAHIAFLHVAVYFREMYMVSRDFELRQDSTFNFWNSSLPRIFANFLGGVSLMLIMTVFVGPG